MIRLLLPLAEGGCFTHPSGSAWSYKIASYSVTNTEIMRREGGSPVCPFSCCQRAMQTPSNSTKETEKISLALATKLFTFDAKSVSVREAGRGQWSSPACCSPYRRRWPRGIVTNKVVNNREWLVIKTTEEKSLDVFWQSAQTGLLASSLTTWAVRLRALRQVLLKEPKGMFYSLLACFHFIIFFFCYYFEVMIDLKNLNV